MMTADNVKAIAMGLGLVGVAFVGYKAYTKAAAVGGGVVEAITGLPQAVADTAAGAVEGIGHVVGIPSTSKTQCQKDLAAGDTWAASFSCTAGDFLGSITGGTYKDQGTGYDMTGERAGVRYDSAGNVIGVY